MTTETKYYWQSCQRCGRATIPAILSEAGQRVCRGLDVALCDILSGEAPRVANPDGSPTQATLDAFAGSGRDPVAFAAAIVDDSLCSDCGHAKTYHQTGEGPWTGFCYADQLDDSDGSLCDCEEPR